MNSIVDSIFIDNLHVMFGEQYLLNTVNTIFTNMAPEYKVVMTNRLYMDDSSNIEDKQREILLNYLSGLLSEFFKKIQKNVIRGGGLNKLEQVKNYIREKVSNIKPKFYN
jgi:hypothetical protein